MTEPLMDHVWVWMAVILAFQKKHKISDRAWMSQFEGGEDALFRKVDAFMSDPENQEAILAEREAAAAAIGRGETKQ